jgi:xanthine/uracil permease
MAKKNKRQSRRSNDVTRSTSTVAAISTTAERDFTPDYSNTIKDLRRIGILAGTFISILLILAFFLR